MDDRPPTLASAVVVPNLPNSPSPPRQSPIATNGHSNTLKRRASQSPTPESATKEELDGETAYAKRVRLSVSHDTINDTKASVFKPNSHTSTSVAPRRRTATDPEADKKRGRRLFGSLLGTLSQTSNAPSAAQQRRVEAERRQRDKLVAQQRPDGASSVDQPGGKQRTAEELEALKHDRAEQQKRWKAEARIVRHASMRAQASFMQTAVQPRLYWLPYEMTRGEEEKVQQQREQVERDIEQEIRIAESLHGEVEGTNGQASGRQELINQAQDQLGNSEQGEEVPNKDDEKGSSVQDHASRADTEPDRYSSAGNGVDTEALETKQNGEQDGKEDEDEDMVLNRDAEEDPVIY